ncbi:hypothetical protein [Edaphobacter sp. HDX4]|uniref:hypothetical protein n=1 Tax=Edaphobacter sp. HDX4 TaxID=2794064 RepID=UPI002FE59D0E
MRNRREQRLQTSMILMGAMLLPASLAAQSAETKAAPCADVPHADHPSKLLSNGKLNVLVFLPDTRNGYYRSTRFDWSGVVGCASVDGHNYFGEWFADYDPLKNDSITGPVEEFRTSVGSPAHTGPKGTMFVQPDAIGYADAKPGELFLKPGVGVLRKVKDAPYQFGFPYPIVDTGKWTVKAKRRSILFRQVLHGPQGYAYVYEKILSLDKNGSVMTLEHHLKNTGTKTIDTSVYDHDFFMLDRKPTGPDMVVHFAFEPKAEDPLGEAGKIEGKDLKFTQPLGPRRGVSGYLTGYSNSPHDYDFTVEDTATGVAVRQTSDSPLARLYFWSTRTTICPEGYIHLNIPPGKTGKWTIRYQFIAPSH